MCILYINVSSMKLNRTEKKQNNNGFWKNSWWKMGTCMIFMDPLIFQVFK